MPSRVRCVHPGRDLAFSLRLHRAQCSAARHVVEIAQHQVTPRIGRAAVIRLRLGHTLQNPLAHRHRFGRALLIGGGVTLVVGKTAFQVDHKKPHHPVTAAFRPEHLHLQKPAPHPHRSGRCSGAARPIHRRPRPDQITMRRHRPERHAAEHRQTAFFVGREHRFAVGIVDPLARQIASQLLQKWRSAHFLKRDYISVEFADDRAQRRLLRLGFRIVRPEAAARRQ